MNPNMAALLAALCFAVMVYPWRATILNLGPAGVFLFAGCAFLLTGAVYWLRQGFAGPLTVHTAGMALAFVAIYVTALVMCGLAFGHPKANVPIATAITAVYPIGTALIAVVLLGQRFTLLETIFFLMAVGGVAGLGLSSKS